MGTKQAKPSSLTEDYKMIKSFTDKNIGSIEMYKHEENSEYIIRKKISSSSYGDSQKLIDLFLRRLETDSHSSLQKIVHIDNSETRKDKKDVYFEFSRINLLDVMKRCKEKGQKIPEDEIWRVLKTMIALGKFFEDKLEHHPSITLQNIFVIGDEFKLVHPYVYDSYLKEIEKEYSEVLLESFEELTKSTGERKVFIMKNLKNPKLIKAHEYNKEKIRINLIQTGLLLLSLGTLENQQSCEENLKGSRLLKTFEYFEKDYSQELCEIIREMVFSESFDDELTFTEVIREWPEIFQTNRRDSVYTSNLGSKEGSAVVNSRGRGSMEPHERAGSHYADSGGKKRRRKTKTKELLSCRKTGRNRKQLLGEKSPSASLNGAFEGEDHNIVPLRGLKVKEMIEERVASNRVTRERGSSAQPKKPKKEKSDTDETSDGNHDFNQMEEGEEHLKGYEKYKKNRSKYSKQLEFKKYKPGLKRPKNEINRDYSKDVRQREHHLNPINQNQSFNSSNKDDYRQNRASIGLSLLAPTSKNRDSLSFRDLRGSASSHVPIPKTAKRDPLAQSINFKRDTRSSLISLQNQFRASTNARKHSQTAGILQNSRNTAQTTTERRMAYEGNISPIKVKPGWGGIKSRTHEDPNHATAPTNPQEPERPTKGRVKYTPEFDPFSTAKKQNPLRNGSLDVLPNSGRLRESLPGSKINQNDFSSSRKHKTGNLNSFNKFDMIVGNRYKAETGSAKESLSLKTNLFGDEKYFKGVAREPARPERSSLAVREIKKVQNLRRSVDIGGDLALKRNNSLVAVSDRSKANRGGVEGRAMRSTLEAAAHNRRAGLGGSIDFGGKQNKNRTQNVKEAANRQSLGHLEDSGMRKMKSSANLRSVASGRFETRENVKHFLGLKLGSKGHQGDVGAKQHQYQQHNQTFDGVNPSNQPNHLRNSNFHLRGSTHTNTNSVTGGGTGQHNAPTPASNNSLRSSFLINQHPSQMNPISDSIVKQTPGYLNDSRVLVDKHPRTNQEFQINSLLAKKKKVGSAATAVINNAKWHSNNGTLKYYNSLQRSLNKKKMEGNKFGSTALNKPANPVKASVAVNNQPNHPNGKNMRSSTQAEEIDVNCNTPKATVTVGGPALANFQPAPAGNQNHLQGRVAASNPSHQPDKTNGGVGVLHGHPGIIKNRSPGSMNQNDGLIQINDFLKPEHHPKTKTLAKLLTSGISGHPGARNTPIPRAVSHTELKDPRKEDDSFERRKNRKNSKKKRQRSVSFNLKNEELSARSLSKKKGGKKKALKSILKNKHRAGNSFVNPKKYENGAMNRGRKSLAARPTHQPHQSLYKSGNQALDSSKPKLSTPVSSLPPSMISTPNNLQNSRKLNNQVNGGKEVVSGTGIRQGPSLHLFGPQAPRIDRKVGNKTSKQHNNSVSYLDGLSKPMLKHYIQNPFKTNKAGDAGSLKVDQRGRRVCSSRDANAGTQSYYTSLLSAKIPPFIKSKYGLKEMAGQARDLKNIKNKTPSAQVLKKDYSYNHNHTMGVKWASMTTTGTPVAGAEKGLSSINAGRGKGYGVSAGWRKEGGKSGSSRIHQSIDLAREKVRGAKPPGAAGGTLGNKLIANLRRARPQDSFLPYNPIRIKESHQAGGMKASGALRMAGVAAKAPGRSENPGRKRSPLRRRENSIGSFQVLSTKNGASGANSYYQRKSSVPVKPDTHGKTNLSIGQLGQPRKHLNGYSKPSGDGLVGVGARMKQLINRNMKLG